MAGPPGQSLSLTDYNVACICSMGKELAAVKGMLDEVHDQIHVDRDQNSYTLGRIGHHNIVVAVMPQTGLCSAAIVATRLLNSFPSIRFGFLVGIGGGVPGGDDDVRLGDVVVGLPKGRYTGVVQFDMGKRVVGGRLERTGQMDKPPLVLLAHVQKLQSQHALEGHRLLHLMSDMLTRWPNLDPEYALPILASDDLFFSIYEHRSGRTCDHCDRTQRVARQQRATSGPHIHYGTIGSSNAVVKDAIFRDQLKAEFDVICVEMEAAGLTDFPCLVIRGICDYADSHKNDRWHHYAAAVAAAYMKELLLIVPSLEIRRAKPTTEIVNQKAEKLAESLQPRDRDLPIKEVKDHESDTLEWLFNGTKEWKASDATARYDQQHGLCSWLVNGAGIYVVAGKPGAGKSTFMTFLRRDRRVLNLLQSDSAPGNTKILFHNFWALGKHPSQRDRKGLLASLARQIMLTDPGVVMGIDINQAQHATYDNWSMREIENLIAQMLQASNYRYCMLIDGLDEALQEQTRDIIQWIQNVVKIQTCKVCLATRQVPELLQIRDCPTMQLHLHTVDDISIYVKRRLEPTLDLLVDREDSEGQQTKYKLLRKLCEMADGVWIWVYHALLAVEKKLYIEDDLEKLFDEVNRLPGGVENFYRLSLKKSQEKFAEYERERRLIFNLGQRFPIPLLRLGVLIDGKDPREYLYMRAQNSEQNWSRFCDRSRRKVYELSGCLVESSPNATRSYEVFTDRGTPYHGTRAWRNETVQFIHRSVFEFLLKEDIIKVRHLFGMNRLLAESLLVCLIADLHNLSLSNIRRICRMLEKVEDQDVRAFQTIDDVCQTLLTSRLSKLNAPGWQTAIGVAGGRWLYHLYEYDERCEQPEALDYTGFLFFEGLMPAILQRIEQQSAYWSAYYKGYLALCAIDGYHRGNEWADFNAFFTVLTLLRKADADFENIHVVRGLSERVPALGKLRLTRKESCVSRLLVETFVRLMIIYEELLDPQPDEQSLESVKQILQFLAMYDLSRCTTAFFMLPPLIKGNFSQIRFRGVTYGRGRQLPGLDSQQPADEATAVFVCDACHIFELLGRVLDMSPTQGIDGEHVREEIRSSLAKIPALLYVMFVDLKTRDEVWLPATGLLEAKLRDISLSGDIIRFRQLCSQMTKPAEGTTLKVIDPPFLQDIAPGVRSDSVPLIPLDPYQEIVVDNWKEVCTIRHHYGYPIHFTDPTERSAAKTERIVSERPATQRKERSAERLQPASPTSSPRKDSMMPGAWVDD